MGVEDEVLQVNFPFRQSLSRALSVFIVDDDEEIQWALQDFFQTMGHRVQVFAGAQAALRQLQMAVAEQGADVQGASDLCDIIVCDFLMPEMDGLSFLQELQAAHLDIPVIVITAHGSVETAVEAMRMGAFDYITKPIHFNELEVISNRAIKVKELERDYARLQKKLRDNSSCADIVGRAPKMQHVFTLMEKVAKTNANVLVMGESGTGKELVARGIHQMSGRLHGPFMAINCAAIPENLLESELFGHAKGSFTGAYARRLGLFQEAHGGSIFLDEIGDLPLSLQSKLLRVLQEKSIKLIGENKVHKIDVRIIAATHKDLREEIQAGRFREDLYYRLAVFPVSVPPLRERPEDIPLLVEHFLQVYTKEHNSRVRGSTKRAMKAMLRMPWKGNVRELENTIERAIILCQSEFIDEEDILMDCLDSPAIVLMPPEENAAMAADMSSAPWPLQSNFFQQIQQSAANGLPTLRQLEREYIQYVLGLTHQHKEKAAQILGINRKTLYRKEMEERFFNNPSPHVDT